MWGLHAAMTADYSLLSIHDWPVKNVHAIKEINNSNKKSFIINKRLFFQNICVQIKINKSFSKVKLQGEKIKCLFCAFWSYCIF